MLWQWIFPPAPPVNSSPRQVAEQVGGVTEGGADTVGALREVEVGSAQQRLQGEEAAASASPGLTDGSPPPPVEPEPQVTIVAESLEDIVLETPEWRAVFSNRGGVLVSLVLSERLGADGEPLEMVRQRAGDDLSVFALVDTDGQSMALNDALFVVERGSRSVTFRHASASGQAVKSFTIEPAASGDYLGVSVDSTAPGWHLWMGPGVRNPPWSELDDRFQKRFRDVTYRVGGETQRVIADKIDGAVRIDASDVDWLSLQDKYFLSAVIPGAGLRSAKVVPVAIEGSEENGLAGFDPLATAEGESRPVDLGLLLEPQSRVLDVATYWSPKQYVELKDLGVGLEETVHWGKLGFIAKPLLYGLRWLHANVTTNYGWCIVLMTLLLRIVLLPLTHTSFVSMQKMQQLNPRMEAIRARYRPKLKDKQGRPNFEQQREMNQEIQKLFKEEKVNPAAGCLPLILQMPIFFAFYQLLVQAVELWGAPWILWINDLSVRDPIWVLPLVMGATQLVQQKFMPTSPNPTQRMIMNTMPIFFTVFALNFPAGLVLYWLTNNVLTIFQQAGYNRLKKAGLFGGEAQLATAKEKR